MAMTGGTEVLLKSEIPEGFGSHAVNLYAYYKYEQSIADNKTTMYCGMYVTTDPGWDIGEWTDRNAGSYIGTTRNTFNGTMPNHSGTYWLTENQKFTVSHDNNGNGSAIIYWKWNVYSTWGGYVYPSGYFNVQLPTIPRNAKITSFPSSFASNGNPPTVHYSNPAGSNVERVEICIADKTAYYGQVPYRPLEKTGTSYTFTAEDIETLKGKVGSAAYELSVTFVIHTVINNVSFWSSSDPVTFTLVEDATTKPTVSMNVSLNNGSLPSTFAGLYIQGKSRLDISLAAEGKYGANISSYSAKVDGKTYTEKPIITDAITASGNVGVFGYAKDSRGFTGEASKQINVIPYSKPLVVPIGSENAISCYRSDGNGVRVGNSTSVWIKAKRTFYSVSGKNLCALQWRSKLITEAWNDQIHQWNDLIGKTVTSTDEYNSLLSGVVFDKKKSYTVQVMAIDDVGEYDLKTFEIPTEDVALHLGKGGKNVAIGTYCNGLPDYRFYSDWKGQFDKGLWGASLNHNVTDVLEDAKEFPDGLTPIVINSSTNKANLPSGNYDYCVGIIHKRAADQYNVILMDYVTGKIAINVHLSGTWTGWKYFTPQ